MFVIIINPVQLPHTERCWLAAVLTVQHMWDTQRWRWRWRWCLYVQAVCNMSLRDINVSQCWEGQHTQHIQGQIAIQCFHNRDFHTSSCISANTTDRIRERFNKLNPHGRDVSRRWNGKQTLCNLYFLSVIILIYILHRDDSWELIPSYNEIILPISFRPTLLRNPNFSCYSTFLRCDRQDQRGGDCESFICWSLNRMRCDDATPDGQPRVGWYYSSQCLRLV